MIDFRYHLVSLVSVFLALAVGIVLGAGPLKESIGNQLTVQVEKLRQEKDDLRTNLDTATDSLDHRDDFVTTVSPMLISGQLSGRSVVLVTLPGVEDEALDPLSEAIISAGGTVTGTVSIGGAWTEAQQVGKRAEVVSALASELPAGSAGTAEVDVRLAQLLARSLVSPTGAPGNGDPEKVLDELRSAELIGIKKDVAGLASAALVLAPALPVTGTDQVAPTPDSDAVAAYLDLATQLDEIGGGAVVTGPASSATAGGVLAAVRKDSEAKSRVSTVDTGSQPAGVVTASFKSAG